MLIAADITFTVRGAARAGHYSAKALCLHNLDGYQQKVSDTKADISHSIITRHTYNKSVAEGSKVGADDILRKAKCRCADAVQLVLHPSS